MKKGKLKINLKLWMKDWKSSMVHSKRNTSPVMNMTKLSRRPRVHSIKYWKVHKPCSMFLKKKVLSSIRRKLLPWEIHKRNDSIDTYSYKWSVYLNRYIRFIHNQPYRYITSKQIKHQQFKFQNSIHIFISLLNWENKFI